MQKVECKENAFGIAARDFQVARIRSTNSKEDFIKILVDVFRRDVLPYFGIVNKLDSSGFEQSNTTVNYRFIEFPVRNAVTQQATRLFAFFINGNSKTFTAKCFGSKQTRRTRTDDRSGFSVGFRFGKYHAAFFERRFDEELLDLTHHHRVVMHVAGTGGFAKCRTHTPRKLREKRCLADDIVSTFRIPYGYCRIEFWNEVSERTARTVAERNSATVAAASLANDFH